MTLSVTGTTYNGNNPSAYLPQVGEVIKMRSWHGVVLEVFRSTQGHTVLRVQTARNIFRKLGPEFIEVELAPEQISPASLSDLQQEIALHQQLQARAIAELLEPLSV